MQNVKKLKRLIYGRTVIVMTLLLVQILILLEVFVWLKRYTFLFYGGFSLISGIVVIHILNEKTDPSFQISWLIPVLLIPIFGSLFYLFVQFQFGTKMIHHRLCQTIRETAVYTKQREEVFQRLKKENEELSRLVFYMNRYAGYPIHQNTEAVFFPLGEDKFEEMKRQLKKAEKFIFMEYFIVEHGVMFDSIMEILEEKVKEGVEVRFLYDGMCTLALMPYSYPKEVEQKGIQCKMFSPVKPLLSTHQNNRDHRKILVIDGKVAFTGGVNLADEYINQKKRFGHWKDTAVMLTGEAVNNFTIMFLQMWNLDTRKKEDYQNYLVPYQEKVRTELGFVLPYGDSPLDKENVGEQVYLDLLQHAKQYVHIMTPYLILDNRMLNALKYAAKSGVEVVIIMPHIPDKKYAYLLARSYYEELLEAGVEIFEYTPGFVHAKEFISDGDKAVVGTINLDFRSLYLHFECAAFFYRNPVITQIEEDYQNTLRQCQRITLEDCQRYGVLKKYAGRVLRIVAPLM